MEKQEAGAARMLATLGLAGMLAGFALVGIYKATFDMIQRNRAEALEQAIYRVLPGAKTRRAFVLRDGDLQPFEGPAGRLPDGEAVYAGFDAGGTPVGFAIPAEGPGFQDTIRLIYGYDPQRKLVVGMEVLESRETPGLGDRIIKDQKFVANFRDLAVAPSIELVKGGRMKQNQVDAISGATISSKAVVRIVNDSNAHWLSRLPDPGGAPGAAPGPSAALRAGGTR